MNKSAQQLIRWHFAMTDTWFFREARSHDALGPAQLRSLFPPPANTLLGAMRTALGDMHNHTGVDWQRFAEGKEDPAIHALIGNGEQLGKLDVRGIHVTHNGERLYPCPLDILGSKNTDSDCVRLTPGPLVLSDIGNVALPHVRSNSPDNSPGGRTNFTGCWINEEGARQWLSGEVPNRSNIVSRSDFISEEYRLGIGRDTRKATVKTGLLYQTRHLRPHEDISLGVEVLMAPVSELTALAEQAFMVRLGGEGRMARTEITQVDAAPWPVTKAAQGKGVLLWLVTPALLGDHYSILPGFQPETLQNGQRVWSGNLEGIPLRLISACVEKPVREGGWDQARNEPRPLRNLTPAGSVFFCEVADSTLAADAARTLHGCRIGHEQEMGRGLVFSSTWNSN